MGSEGDKAYDKDESNNKSLALGWYVMLLWGACKLNAPLFVALISESAQVRGRADVAMRLRLLLLCAEQISALQKIEPAEPQFDESSVTISPLFEDDDEDDGEC